MPKYSVEKLVSNIFTWKLYCLTFHLKNLCCLAGYFKNCLPKFSFRTYVSLKFHLRNLLLKSSLEKLIVFIYTEEVGCLIFYLKNPHEKLVAQNFTCKNWVPELLTWKIGCPHLHSKSLLPNFSYGNFLSTLFEKLLVSVLFVYISTQKADGLNCHLWKLITSIDGLNFHLKNWL